MKSASAPILGTTRFDLKGGKAYIVSLPKISRITGNSVVMSNGHEIFVPKSSIPGLRSAYFDYFEKI